MVNLLVEEREKIEKKIIFLFWEVIFFFLNYFKEEKNCGKYFVVILFFLNFVLGWFFN